MRGSAEEEVRKHRDRVTGAWKQISIQRRRVDVSYDPIMGTALLHGTWMDEGGFKKTCIKEKKKRGDIHQPFYGTWVANFMLRQDAGRFMLGKYLSDKKKSHIPNLSFVFSNAFFVHLYFRIYQNNFQISAKYIFQKFQNSFQKHPQTLVHYLQTCVFLSKPELTPQKKLAPPGATALHTSVFWCILVYSGVFWRLRSVGDDWGWRWQEIHQHPFFLPKYARYNQQGVGCAEYRKRPEVRALTVWRLKHTVISTEQAAKEWQRQLRLPTTSSGGTCMTACTLHKSQKASSSLSRLTKKRT